MVHHDTRPRAQGGTPHRFDIGAKHLRIARPVDGHHRLPALEAQSPQPGHSGAVGLGHTSHRAFPGGGPPIQARQRQMHARFIAALHAPEVACREALAVVRARWLEARGVARAGLARLLLRGKPRRGSTRPIVAPLTWMPRASTTRAHSSSQVRSALSCTHGWTRVVAAAREGRGPPACAWGARSPVVR
jgi:hypothetical protein